MAHRIDAFLLKGSFDKAAADEFGLQPIPLPGGLHLFPLKAGFIDSWNEKLAFDFDAPDFPLLTCSLLHHIARSLAETPLFAVIHTNYFGGRGTQMAAVYRGDAEVMAPETAEFGPINKALSLLGVTATEPMDEFDTVSLARFRTFDDLFE